MMILGIVVFLACVIYFVIQFIDMLNIGPSFNAITHRTTFRHTSILDKLPEYATMIALLIVSVFWFPLSLLMLVREKILEARQRVLELSEGYEEIPAEEFLNRRNVLTGSRIDGSSEFTGVYVLHNTTQDRYYVGQSIRVLDRVNQHFTGHGNGDVYCDFKNGDHFTVRTISLVSSGYESINDLERQLIDAHDAYRRGYNKTRGNSR